MPAYIAPNPATIKVFVFNERMNKFIPRTMTRIVCPECGADFESMVWYDANRHNVQPDPVWVVECECGEQWTSSDPEL